MSHRSKKFIHVHQENISSTMYKSMKTKSIKKPATKISVPVFTLKQNRALNRKSAKPAKSHKKKLVPNKDRILKPIIYNRFDFKNYKQAVLKLFKLLYHDSIPTDMDLMRNDNFFNLMSFISELNEDPSGYVSFQKQCNKNLDKKMIILNNEETKKKLEAMEIFIKIYNSLKKFVNSWDSDQQIKSLTRKFKLSPNFFSKIYQSIDISSDISLPSQRDLKFFEERTKSENEDIENNENHITKKDTILSFGNSDNKESQDEQKIVWHKNNNRMNRSKKQSENKENTLMDIVDFIFLLAKTENTSELQPSFFIGNQGNNTKTMEYNPEIEEENSLSTDQSNNAYKKNQNFQEKLLESLMNEENINYSSLINKILMPISKKIIGLIGDFTMAYGRLRELLKKKDLEEKKKAFLRKNIIISPPVKNS